MIRLLCYAFIWIALMAGPARAASFRVACAANFTAPLKELANQYARETGDRVDCTFGSTGMLYGQIVNGAPYDLFLAADEERPALLHDAGRAAAPVTYARGAVVVWTTDDLLASLPDWKSVVTSPDADRIGVASPKTAPYGRCAMEAMASARIQTRVRSKLVFGKSVGTAFQYAYSGSADAGFVALSQALSSRGASGKYWPVDEALPVIQAACVLKSGNAESAGRFLNWLASDTARTIIKRYGYE